MVGKAARLSKEVLEAHYHLPMAEVAKKFEVCMTYFKKVCRQNGVKRWPYRQVVSFGKRQGAPAATRGIGDIHFDTARPNLKLQPSISDASEDSDDTTSWRSGGSDGSSQSQGVKRGREETDETTPPQKKRSSAMDVLAMVAIQSPKAQPADGPNSAQSNETQALKTWTERASKQHLIASATMESKAWVAHSEPKAHEMRKSISGCGTAPQSIKLPIPNSMLNVSESSLIAHQCGAVSREDTSPPIVGLSLAALLANSMRASPLWQPSSLLAPPSPAQLLGTARSQSSGHSADHVMSIHNLLWQQH